jgi:hypothetical protein
MFVSASFLSMCLISLLQNEKQNENEVKQSENVRKCFALTLTLALFDVGATGFEPVTPCL